MKNLGDGSGTDGLAAFTDGELGASFKSNWVDKFNGEGRVVARHDHIDIGWKGDRTSDVGGAEEELWTIAVKEGSVTSTFVFRQNVDGRGEFVVWDDRARFGKDLSTFDLVVGDTTEKDTDVVSAFGEVKGLTEHLKTGDNRFLSRTDANDFDFVVHIGTATFDTAGDDGATARDGHDVFDRHQEWLVIRTDWIWDIGIESVHEFKDWFGIGIFARRNFGRGKSAATDDWEFVARESVFGEKVTDVHLNDVDEFWIVDHISLVKEDDDRRNADLTSKKDVFTSLRHNAVGGCNNKDSGIHLGGAGDHVLDVVSVPWAVDVGIVTMSGLILFVSRVDGDATSTLFWSAVDAGIADVFRISFNSVGLFAN